MEKKNLKFVAAYELEPTTLSPVTTNYLTYNLFIFTKKGNKNYKK